MKMLNGKKEHISLLYPIDYAGEVKKLSDEAIHDIGLDTVCKSITQKESESGYIMRIMAELNDDPKVASYRIAIFEDIIKYPQMREHMMTILDRINFLRDYGTFKREYEEKAGAWDLLHRLEELNDYITCIEALNECLSDVDITSDGLIGLRDYVQNLYTDRAFKELKEDISRLKASTSDLKSVTVGINLNDRFEASSLGLISINSKPFTKSNIIGEFCDMIASKNDIKKDTEWDDNYKYHPVTEGDLKALSALERVAKVTAARSNPLLAGSLAISLSAIPEGDAAEDVTRYLDRIANHMLDSLIKKLRSTLTQYVSVTITDITKLIPEFMYYIRWAEFIEKMTDQGYRFSPASVIEKTSSIDVHAKGIYNLKLACSDVAADAIVPNDLDFAEDKCVYILTGANRGGKTTFTQAVGLLFVLAQGGIRIPGDSFEFSPVDCIYTHFPADEDKTMDLGRLGEECTRFLKLYKACTESSLLLLNETFSTTSFEEGYYIAKDSVRAILDKGIRTIYNTHMHKLASDTNELSASSSYKAESLIVETCDHERSFRVKIAPPEGMSYARDIAAKYGVTYEMLTE